MCLHVCLSMVGTQHADSQLEKISEKYIGGYIYEDFVPTSDDEGVQNAMKDYAEMFFRTHLETIKNRITDSLLELEISRRNIEKIQTKILDINIFHF